MARADWPRGRYIIRSAPWAPLLGSAGAGAALLVLAAFAHRTVIAVTTTELGLLACGAAAAYLLDEEATSVADATPTSRRRRGAWRMLVAVVPTAVAASGLFTLSLLDPATHWLRLLPLAIGVIAIGIALAAAFRHRGLAAPGDLAGTLTLVGTILVVAIDPLQRWVTLAPLGEAAHPGRSTALWIAVVAVCAGIALTCIGDGHWRRVRARH